jgi:hypothetical protein
LRSSAALGAAAVVLLAAGSAHGRPVVRAGGDWDRFGYDAARSNSGPASTGITAANVAKLTRRQVQLGGTADSSPIYLRGVKVAGRTRDVFFLTTSYGRAVAVDASSGRVVWRFTPQGYASWAGSERITNSSPIADPSRRYVYSASPDGKIHKLALASGREVRSGGWPVTITRLPEREKIGPPLNYSRGLVLAATGGYIGDAPPYQGHVVAIDGGSGRIVNVWNSLCSDRHELIDPSSCRQSDSAIWGRAAVVVEPGSGNLLVATGNAPFDGKRNWGDSVLRLTGDAHRLLQNWTPRNQAQLNATDLDLGSTAPALLGDGLALQGGKAAVLDVLDLARMNGRGGASAKLGGQVQELPAPGGQDVFSAPAVWRHGTTTTVFVTTGAGTGAYRVSGRRLHPLWSNDHAGTSPVLAGGLLYVYDPGGGLRVYRPSTGRVVTELQAGAGHWNSPVIAGGRIVLPEGNANDHQATGVIDLWSSGG